MTELNREFIIPDGAQYQDIEYYVGDVSRNRNAGGLYYKIDYIDRAYYWCGHDWLKSSRRTKEVRGFCKILEKN